MFNELVIRSLWQRDEMFNPVYDTSLKEFMVNIINITSITLSNQ